MGKKVMIKTTPLKYNFREHDLTSETILHYDAIRHMTVWEVVGSSLMYCFGLLDMLFVCLSYGNSSIRARATMV